MRNDLGICFSIQRQCLTMSAVAPIGDKRGRGWNVRFFAKSKPSTGSPGTESETGHPGVANSMMRSKDRLRCRSDALFGQSGEA